MTLERTKKNLNHYKEATAAAEENLKQVKEIFCLELNEMKFKINIS